MYKIFRPSVFVNFIIAIIFSACTSSVRVQVMRPANITVPKNINKIAVVNRSTASKDNKAENIIEGVLTGEFIQTDKRASQDAVLGLVNGLSRSPRFTATQTSVVLKGTGTGRMPEPLNWNEVQKICNDNNCDALLLLEVFDSDSRIGLGTREVSRTVEGKTIKSLEHVANAHVVVTSGWRLYDPTTKTIVDEIKGEDFRDFSWGGPTPEAATANLPAKERLIKETGFYAGENYAYRISPMWIWVNRDYYSKGSPELKRAALKVRANNWTDAATTWGKLAETSSSEKIRKRACYNMILACEVEGKLDLALQWANKAIDNGCKPAVNYSNIIKRRISDEKRVKQQMEE